jgi:hypothetical protein
MKKLEDKNNKAVSMLLPLHELLPHKGANSISTLLIFKQGGSAMLPCSKVQFYADQDGTMLVREVLAGNDMHADMDPMILSEGKIWANFTEGNKMLLQAHDRESIDAKLECAVFHVPKEWTAVCWLTEVLTSSLIG